ncbi:aminotransferase class I/II-fold pyridoxal phosphate-dependent enzyme [archaeon]|jgi:aspartate/methionine/tyrosine aminotransferase|nr:aminotransferase class I/II-fold pyridoxal phosphate-dependent enzyme [archaeon]MBT6823880.1 aminotransferase class I/II-fold pyridoxal phosphate-dependent enzyme [archaeon]MBT7107215.1 aminotransferase class I/II-fold pyridoxal phosphate-dependent enzyme [archaeon]MBT7297826.1 aminotransferase class I/II-fold pyridoxal phosphate-dependent enzyme [archaeon]
MNPLAKKLNRDIKASNSIVYDILSKKGREMFYPSHGILAQAAEAKGKKINATIGIALEENGEILCLDSISSNVNLPKNEVFNYVPSYGKINLRKKWQELIFKKNPSLKGEKISLPVVTNAITHGLSMCGYLFLNKGDEVIIPSPFWGNYRFIFDNAYGSKIVNFPIFDSGRFNVEGLKKILNKRGRKKVLLLNFPNNPTGYTPLEEDIPKIVKTIKTAAQNGKKIVVLIDDAYFGLIYENNVYKESIFSELCKVHKNVLAVKIDGVTKEDYAWGLRVGFVSYGIKSGNDKLYSALADKTGGAVRGNISNAPNISQSLVLSSFKDSKYNSQKAKKYAILKKRANKVKQILKKHPEYRDEFEALPFNSGYFMCIVLKNHDPEKIRNILLDKYDTGTIAFPGLLRVAFSATPYNLLEELFENIYHACKKN